MPSKSCVFDVYRVLQSAKYLIDKEKGSIMLSKIEMYIEKYKDHLFWTFMAGSYGCMAFLFSAQALRIKGKYLSDLDVHLSHAIESSGSGYSLESTLTVLIYRIFGKNATACMIGFSLLLALMVVLTPLAVASLLSFLDRTEKGTPLGVTRNRFIGLFSIYIAPLMIPVVWFWFYNNNCNINAWHNSTYMEMRLFSVMALCLYFVIQEGLLNGKNIRLTYWSAFAACLFAATWFKPSYFVGFAPVMVIWLLIDLVKSRGDLTKIRNLFFFGCACIPAGLMVILQYWKLYGSREDVSVVLNTAQDSLRNNIRTGLFLILPVIIFLYNRKKVVSEYKKGNRAYVQIMVLWVIEWLYGRIFTEEGRTGGNFGWGVRMANYLVVAVCVRLFWINLLDVLQKRKDGQALTKAECIYVIGIGAVLLWEMVCGSFYFLWLLTGRSYWM